MKYDLSVLICTLPNRDPKPLLDKLMFQSQKHSIQVLYLGDNKSMSVGEKRNHLLSMASGKYITFRDDDDDITDDHTDSIFELIPKNHDVITFQVDKRFNGQQDRFQKFSREYGLNHRSPDKKFNLMLPNHLCVWRKDVINVKFPHINLAEDHQWAQLMLPYYSNEGHIDKVLYIYDFWKDKTETQR